MSLTPTPSRSCRRTAMSSTLTMPSRSHRRELDDADAAITLPTPRGPELDAETITLPTL